MTALTAFVDADKVLTAASSFDQLVEESKLISPDYHYAHQPHQELLGTVSQ